MPSGSSISFLKAARNSRADGAVDDAVIDRERAAHHRGDRELAVLHDGALLAGADRQDAALRRVDDGGELLDAEHAEIGDREAAALDTPRASACRRARRRARSFISAEICARPFFVGVADDRRDQAAGDGDGDRDVDAVVHDACRHRVQEALAAGTFFSASAAALMMKSLTESL